MKLFLIFSIRLVFFLNFSFAQTQTPQATPSDSTTGFKIVKFDSGTLFEKMGFQPGDTVITVNGQLMKNGKELLQTVEAAESGTSFVIEIKRDGKRQTLIYKVK